MSLPCRNEQAMKERLAVTLAVALVAIAVPSAAGAYRREGGRWPTATVTYYNEVPAYTWAVDTAAYAWNSSGAHVQFLKSPNARSADILVGVRWFKIAGEARIQRMGGRIVGAQIGIRNGQDRYTMALVLTHELGHVLG